MLSIVLALVLLQQPQEVSKAQKPDTVKISDASNQKLKDIVQQMKDLQAQVEAGQKDAQNILLQVVIETIKSHPGFNEQDYDVVLQDGNYVFKRKEDSGVKGPTVKSVPAPPAGKHP